MTPPTTIKPAPSLGAPRVAVVRSRYNDWITSALLRGAVEEYERRFGDASAVVVLEAPGSFELPVLCRAAASSGRYDAVVALGCVIRGETTHDQHINSAVSGALMGIACETGVPVGFGVLTVDSSEQAEARAGGAKGNKGTEAMAAALDTAAMLAAFRARTEGAPGGAKH